VADLLGVVEGNRLGGMYDVPRLIRDGVVLPDAEAMTAFAAGAYNRVPVIFGSNLHENRLFALFASEHVSRVFGLPVRVRDLRQYQLEADYASLMWKARGVDEPAAALAAVQGPGVYAYRFDWDDEPNLLWLDLSELLGAAHGLDIPFVFGRLRFFGRGWPIFSAGRAEQDMALARAMGSYWTQFARTGGPGRGGDGTLPEWRAWGEADGGHFLVLDSEHDGGVRMDGDVVTREEVIRRIGRDARFAFVGERCRVYAQFVRWGGGMSREAYDAIHDGRCREQHPLEERAGR
jgi:para-nitrobenzyl esterase